MISSDSTALEPSADGAAHLQRVAGLSTLLSNLRAVRTLDISCTRGTHILAK